VLEVRGPVRIGVEARALAPDPGRALVACGPPEGSRADWLVEKLAEMGVRVLQPLQTARGGWGGFQARRERLDRLAIAALRQSRQAWALEIRDPLGVPVWLGALPPGSERWVADPGGGSPAGLGETEDAVAVVGPAAGLDSAERALLDRAGFLPVRLGSARLRTETAGLAWAALWAARRAAGTRPTSP
jgi:16S rRNA (uracil1498-N3)-methyltransferase